jgi:ribosome-binding factor A
VTPRAEDGRASRRYPRTARVNEILRQVLAEVLERAADSDERLTLLTVTGVETDPDLRRARVLFASLTDERRVALEDIRIRLQAEVARQVRLKWTPQLSFAVDPAVSTGQRVEDLLRELRSTEHGDGDRDDPG